jgi:hypothetical protein
MKEGDVVLTPLPQADAREKPPPCPALRRMPGFGDWLLCGIGAQLHQEVPGFDEPIRAKEADYPSSGLKARPWFVSDSSRWLPIGVCSVPSAPWPRSVTADCCGGSPPTCQGLNRGSRGQAGNPPAARTPVTVHGVAGRAGAEAAVGCRGKRGNPVAS